MSYGQRTLVAIIITLITILALALISWLLGRWDVTQAQTQPQGVEVYEGIPFDPSLLALDRRGLDEAYHDHIVKLFGVWLSSGAPEEAKNFKNGLRIARRAFGQARDQIRRREEQLNEMDVQHQQQQGTKP